MIGAKGATLRKLFTTIGGAHFKSVTEIVVNNSYLIVQSTPTRRVWNTGCPNGYTLSRKARPPGGYEIRCALLGIFFPSPVDLFFHLLHSEQSAQ